VTAELALSVSVVALSLVACLTLATVPVLLWRVLRQADELVRLREDVRTLRGDVDKVDAVLDGMIRGGGVE
jgi:hypothetical protein